MTSSPTSSPEDDLQIVHPAARAGGAMRVGLPLARVSGNAQIRGNRLAVAVHPV
jgi:hypothetical protein